MVVLKAISPQWMCCVGDWMNSGSDQGGNRIYKGPHVQILTLQMYLVKPDRCLAGLWAVTGTVTHPSEVGMLP